MAIPSVNLTVKDGALGITNNDGGNVIAIMATSSAGPLNTPVSFTNSQAVRDTFGTGPLVEEAAHVLDIAGGTVVCLRLTGSVAGTAGSVTQTGTGLSVLTTTGSVPLDSYQVRVLIVTGATNPAAGLATFKVSLDDGRNYGPELALPTSGVYAVPNTGITLNFSAASLVAGDYYSFLTTAPGYSTSNFNTGYDALMAADGLAFSLIDLVGVPADATAMQGFFAAFDAKLSASASTSKRYFRGLMQAIDDTDANIITAGASLVSTRMNIAAGFANITSSITGMSTKRPASRVIAARWALTPAAEDAGRVATGPCRGIVSLLRDEAKTPGLDAAGYSTLRTQVGLPGYYITNSRLRGGPLSDFQLSQYGRVMDIAAGNVYVSGLHFLNDNTVVDRRTGLIVEASARSIESYCRSRLLAVTVQQGQASDASVVVDRATNILSTSELKIAFTILPLGYFKTITETISFTNPALQAA